MFVSHFLVFILSVKLSYFPLMHSFHLQEEVTISSFVSSFYPLKKTSRCIIQVVLFLVN